MTTGQMLGNALRQDLRKLWESYARVLSYLARTFPAEDLPDLDYLLDEDEDTIGLVPLRSDRSRKTWYSGGQLKKKHRDPDVKRADEETEMLYRVRELLVDGLQLAVDKVI